MSVLAAAHGTVLFIYNSLPRNYLNGPRRTIHAALQFQDAKVTAIDRNPLPERYVQQMSNMPKWVLTGRPKGYALEYNLSKGRHY